VDGAIFPSGAVGVFNEQSTDPKEWIKVGPRVSRGQCPKSFFLRADALGLVRTGLVAASEPNGLEDNLSRGLCCLGVSE
jgi:hypothetical protein